MLLVLGLLFGAISSTLALLETYDKIVPSKWIEVVQWIGMVTCVIGVIAFMISHGGFAGFKF